MNWGEKLSKTTKTGEKLKNKTKRKEINKFGKQNKKQTIHWQGGVMVFSLKEFLFKILNDDDDNNTEEKYSGSHCVFIIIQDNE